MQAVGQMMTLKHMLDASKLNAAHLQVYDLENQQRRQTMGADKALADLMTQNTKPGPDGTPVRDDNAIVSGLTSQGYGNRALKYVDDMRAQRTAQLANQEAQDRITKERGTTIAQALQSVEDAPPDQREARHQAVRQSLIQQKLVTDPARFPLHYADNPTFYPTQIGQWTTTSQALQKRENDRNYALKLDEFAHKKEDAAPKNVQEWAKALGEVLGTAANQDQWQAGMNALRAKGAPDAMLSRFSPTFSTDQVDAANSLGQTSQERSTEAHRTAQEEHAQRNEELRSRQLDIQGRRTDALIETNQQNADTRRDLADWRMSQGAKGTKLTGNQFSALMRDEGKLNRERRLLGAALSGGDSYVNRLGDVLDQAPTDTQREAMRQRYLETSDELKKLVEVKNNHLAATGAKVGVSTQTAQAAIHAGDQKLHSSIIKKRPDDEGLGFGKPSPDTASDTTTPTAPAKATPAAAAAPMPQGPPISLLKENVHTTLKNPATGKTEVWTLQNGRQLKLQ
jgi:hypothetical protein